MLSSCDVKTGLPKPLLVGVRAVQLNCTLIRLLADEPYDWHRGVEETD